jgi:hypothetical protein
MLKEDLSKFQDGVIDFFWDAKDKTIRGSSTNWTITMTYLTLIIIGCFSDQIMNRLVKLAELMLFFFTASMGIWSTGRYLKYSKDKEVEIEACKKPTPDNS